MFKKLVVLTLALGQGDCLYKITSLNQGARHELCMSNPTSFESVIDYWGSMDRALGEGDRECDIGGGVKSYTTASTTKKLVRTVVDSMTALNMSCSIKDSPDKLIHLMFDAEYDGHLAPMIVSCIDGSAQGPLRIAGSHSTNKIIHFPKGASVEEGTSPPEVSEKPDDLSDEISYRIKSLTSGNNDPGSLVHVISSKDHELSTLKEEINSLKSRLEHEREDRDRLRAEHKAQIGHGDAERKLLEDRLRAREQDIHNDRAELQQLKAKLRSLENARVPVTTIAPKAITTALTVVSLLSAVGADLNNWTHAANRPGIGTFLFDGGDNDCASVTYGTKCSSFLTLLDDNKYPLFNTFVHKYSSLEAVTNNIIQKDDNGVCKTDAERSNKKCFDEMKFMKMSCPNHMRSVHYIDSVGKLRGMICADEHEVTEDCLQCRKLTQKDAITKGSVSLQDVVCQKGSSNYEGTQPKIKGVCRIGEQDIKTCKRWTTNYETVPFAVFSHSSGMKKLYLPHLKVKSVEVIDNDSFVCYQHVGQSSGNKKDATDTRLMLRVAMTDCKNVDSTKTKKCTGDEVFCSHFKCTQEYPDTYCLSAPGGGPLYVDIKGSWIMPACVGYETLLVYREVLPLTVKSTQECQSCYYECRQDGIMIRSTGFNILSATACSHGSCRSASQKSGTEITIPYPGLSKSQGGEIGVHLAHDDTDVSSKLTISCKPRDQCEAHSCIFCWEVFINYQCHSFLSSFVICCLVIAVTGLALKALFYTMKKVKSVRKCVVYPIKWTSHLLIFLLAATRKGLQRATGIVNERIGWEDERPLAVRRRVVPIQKYALPLLMALVTGSYACTEMAIASSKMIKCQTEGGSTNCKASGSVLLKAGPIGSEACLVLKGSQEDQKKFISVKTLSSELICLEGQDFWTGLYIPKCLSSRRCHLVGGCTGDSCQKWNNDHVSGEFKNLVDNERMYENRCFEQCGGLGCGCFNIQASCLFVHAELESVKKEAIRAFSCVDWVHRLTLEVKDTQGNVEKVVLNDMNTKMFPWGSITLALDAEGMTSSNPFTFLQNREGGFALVDEPFPNVPRRGQIGEIRCSNEAAALSAHKSCVRIQDTINYRPHMDSVECTANLIDPFTAFLKGSLPQTRGGMTFASSIDGKTVQAMASRSVKAQVSLSLDEYDFSFLSTVKDCTASFANMSGCYSCNEGAKVCIRAKVTQSTTYIAHSKDFSINMALELRPSTEDYCQILHFSKPLIEETMSYTCGGPDKTMVISGHLIAVDVTTGTNTTGGDSTVVNPSEDSWSLFGWFSGLVDWLGGPFKALIKIGGYILGAVIVIALLALALRLSVPLIIKSFRKKTN
ncbi:polyprotein [Viola virus]|uniref:Envelopment polyprotein n=1 Tax=Viola virus TaxID=2182586 RepID=A0A343X9V7_9VIRU|nr:polyprotein [Viola virus]AWH90183.1 polyprotein [Viola virus]